MVGAARLGPSQRLRILRFRPSRLADERARAQAREAELRGDRQRLSTQLEELEGHTYRKSFGREVDEMEERLARRQHETHRQGERSCPAGVERAARPV